MLPSRALLIVNRFFCLFVRTTSLASNRADLTSFFLASCFKDCRAFVVARSSYDTCYWHLNMSFMALVLQPSRHQRANLSDLLVQLPLFRPQLPVPLFQPLLWRGSVYIPVDTLEHSSDCSLASGVAGERGRKVVSREVDGIRLEARPSAPFERALKFRVKPLG